MENKFDRIKFREIIKQKAKEASLPLDQFVVDRLGISKKTFYNAVLEKASIQVLISTLNLVGVPIDEVVSTTGRVSRNLLEEKNQEIAVYKKTLELKNTKIAELKEEISKNNVTIQFLLDAKRNTATIKNQTIITLPSKVKT